MVAEVRKRLAVNKQTKENSGMERFNLKNLKGVVVKKY
jgi:hypothetical protein